MTPLHLAPAERQALSDIAASTHEARILRRAQSLIWVGNGDSVQAAADRQNIPRYQIYYWIHRFHESQEPDLLRRLSDIPHLGRPPKIKGVIDPILEKVIDEDPRSYGYAHTHWTADLLVHFLKNRHSLTCSSDSVRQALHRVGIAWKAPRYRLKRRDPAWRQKKGA